MKEIKLTQGKVALVDDEDFEYLNQFKWYASKCRKTFYAQRCVKVAVNKWVIIKMHRVLLNTPSHLMVDHIDHNGLNNQKANIRNCTQLQNAKNITSRGRSKYLGVYYTSSTIKGVRYEYITASIRVNRKLISLGNHKTEIEAAKAYDQAAKKYFGEFANLNFKKVA